MSCHSFYFLPHVILAWGTAPAWVPKVDIGLLRDEEYKMARLWKVLTTDSKWFLSISTLFVRTVLALVINWKDLKSVEHLSQSTDCGGCSGNIMEASYKWIAGYPRRKIVMWTVSQLCSSCPCASVKLLKWEGYLEYVSSTSYFTYEKHKAREVWMISIA